MLRRFAVVFTASATLMLLVAWPVVERPTERIYGTEISGRHPDPFAAMRRLDFSIADRFTQPGTDWTGAAIAQFAGPVAAYNLIVLLSFPLAAASTDLLVFLLTGSSLGSAWAGLMVMLAPYHLAHAAYHPHVAQIGWLALALAAIVAFVDRPSAIRAGAVAISMAWLGAADFYGGFIGLVLAPVVAIARVAMQPAGTRDSRAPAAAGLIAVGSVATLAAVNWWLLARPGVPLFNEAQVLMFRARWWAYFLPPVDQPWWGDRSVQVIGEAGLLPAIVELQLTPGFFALGLAVWGTRVAFTTARAQERAAAGVALAIVTAATMASLAPVAIWLHRLAPVFRGMARFGGAVEIGVSVLAGLGLASLVRRDPSRRTMVIGVATLALFVECAPLPWRWRDVLPTLAHRWLAGFPASATVLDCSAPLGGDGAVEMAFGNRLTEAGGARFPYCGDADMPARAAADGIAFVLVQPGTDMGRAWASQPPAGIRVMRRLPGASVYAVIAAPPAVFVDRVSGCGQREWRNGDSFCWAQQRLELTVRNTTPAPATVTLAITLATKSGSGSLVVRGPDGVPRHISVRGPLKPYSVGPLQLSPGLSPISIESDNRDAFAVGPWTWRTDPS
jgi:hypothetical protein